MKSLTHRHLLAVVFCLSGINVSLAQQTTQNDNNPKKIQKASDDATNLNMHPGPVNKTKTGKAAESNVSSLQLASPPPQRKLNNAKNSNLLKEVADPAIEKNKTGTSKDKTNVPAVKDSDK